MTISALGLISTRGLASSCQLGSFAVSEQAVGPPAPRAGRRPGSAKSFGTKSEASPDDDDDDDDDGDDDDDDDDDDGAR